MGEMVEMEEVRVVLVLVPTLMDREQEEVEELVLLTTEAKVAWRLEQLNARHRHNLELEFLWLKEAILFHIIIELALQQFLQLMGLSKGDLVVLLGEVREELEVTVFQLGGQLPELAVNPVGQDLYAELEEVVVELNRLQRQLVNLLVLQVVVVEVMLETQAVLEIREILEEQLLH